MVKSRSRFLLLAILVGCLSLCGCSTIIKIFTTGGGIFGNAEDEEPPPPPPAILFMVPSHFPTTGGQTLTIHAYDVQVGAQILIDGTPCTNIVVDSIVKIHGDVPPHAAGAADVTILNPDGQSVTAPDAIMYTTGPILRTLAPSRGTEAGGTTVTLAGFNFAAGMTVTFAGAPAGAVMIISSTQATVVTPAGAVGQAPVVATVGGQSYTFNYYEYTPAPPDIVSVNPISGTNMGGNTVTISGFYFQPGAMVLFGLNQSPNVTFVSANTLTVVVPIGPHVAGTVDVTVVNPDLQQDVLPSSYTYVYVNPAPTIASISPDWGPTSGGTQITITGTGFMAGARVTLGSVQAGGVAVLSSTQITAWTSAAPSYTVATSVNVTVTNPDIQTATLSNGFTYVPPAGWRTNQYAIDGSTNCDLWYCDFSTNLTLFQADMQALGLHTGGADANTDGTAEDYLKAQILGYSSQYYKRNFSGTKIVGTSFNICFVGSIPSSPWTAPPAFGGYMQANMYNIMEFGGPDPNAGGALGRASLDWTTYTSGLPSNGRRENNARSSGLGIFTGAVSSSSLSPALGAADVVYLNGAYWLGKGSAAQDTRFTAVRNAMSTYADRVATVNIHETGHSVGLVITSRNSGNHCTNVCPMRAVASWGTTTFCTGSSSCTTELASSLGYSP
jgi:hypothetical protein